MDDDEQEWLEDWLDQIDRPAAPVKPRRPVGMSNHAWALRQLDYEQPETHWGWTHQYLSPR